RVEIDADREIPNANFSLFESDHMRLAARKNVRVRHDASHALQKVAHVAPGLEPEKIELKQRVQKPLLLRKLRKNIVWRKWDVQEKRQSRKFSGDALLAQCLRDVHQVIIVHPDEIVGLRTPGDRVRVPFVHLLVSLPIPRLEIAEILQVVK